MKIMEKDYFLREEEGKYQATHETLKLTEEQRRFFERDVVVHCKQLFRYLSTLSRDYELSRDMVQETMIVAQRYYAMGQVRNRENVLGWLRKIARNILVSHFRKQVRMNARLDAHRFQICDNLGWILLDDKFVENVSVEQFCGEDETKESVRKAKVLQNLAITGAVIVSTPQEVALADARKGIDMYWNEKVNVPILGLVENMAWFTPAELPENRYYLFGKDGVKRLAEEMGVPLLGQIPIVQSICESGDKGEPAAVNAQTVTGAAFRNLAEAVVTETERRNREQPPTHIVEMQK